MVGFKDPEENEIKEFNKHERIVEVSTSEILNEEERAKREQVISREKEKQKKRSFKDSKIVNEAQKAMLGVPKTSSQFETDFKSIKNNHALKLDYLLRVAPESLPVIFKNSLETDLLIQIV